MGYLVKCGDEGSLHKRILFNLLILDVEEESLKISTLDLPPSVSKGPKETLDMSMSPIHGIELGMLPVVLK
jgi:hypothetical protein